VPIKRTRASGRRGAIGTVGIMVPTVGSSRYEEDLESSGLAPGAVCLAPTAGLWRIIFSQDCASDSQDLFSASLCVPSAMCWQYSAFRRYSSRLSITPHSTVSPGTSRSATGSGRSKRILRKQFNYRLTRQPTVADLTLSKETPATRACVGRGRESPDAAWGKPSPGAPIRPAAPELFNITDDRGSVRGSPTPPQGRFDSQSSRDIFTGQCRCVRVLAHDLQASSNPPCHPQAACLRAAATGFTKSSSTASYGIDHPNRACRATLRFRRPNRKCFGKQNDYDRGPLRFFFCVADGPPPRQLNPQLLPECSVTCRGQTCQERE
jgi:hypothetical protein